MWQVKLKHNTIYNQFKKLKFKYKSNNNAKDYKMLMKKPKI